MNTDGFCRGGEGEVPSEPQNLGAADGLWGFRTTDGYGSTRMDAGVF